MAEEEAKKAPTIRKKRVKKVDEMGTMFEKKLEEAKARIAEARKLKLKQKKLQEKLAEARAMKR